MNVKIITIVLAGGQSSRMGRDKALLEIDGVSLLQRTCQIARHCTDEVYIVTPWGDRYAALLPQGCQIILEQPLQHPLAPENKSQGPLVGFAQALEQVQANWVMLLACDLPCLKVDVLQAAIAQLPQVPETAIAFLPRQTKGWEPLCGFYRHHCLVPLQEFIRQGGRSFQPWLNQHSIYPLKLTDPQILFNCNTPEDLRTATLF